MPGWRWHDWLFAMLFVLSSLAWHDYAEWQGCGHGPIPLRGEP